MYYNICPNMSCASIGTLNLSWGLSKPKQSSKFKYFKIVFVVLLLLLLQVMLHKQSKASYSHCLLPDNWSDQHLHGWQWWCLGSQSSKVSWMISRLPNKIFKLPIMWISLVHVFSCFTAAWILTLKWICQTQACQCQMKTYWKSLTLTFCHFLHHPMTC